MTYTISDIHGNYKKYINALETINFTADDTLYVVGDVIDRGDNSIAVLQDMMTRKNIIPLIGNHEYMAIKALNYLNSNFVDLANPDTKSLPNVITWLLNGGEKTFEDLRNLPDEKQTEIEEYIKDFELFAEIAVNGKDYIIMHTVLQGVQPNTLPTDYDLKHLIFERVDYDKTYYDDKILITGHTPTPMLILNNCESTILKYNNHINIDCGCGMGENLGILCLDNGQEFYV